MVHRPPLKTSSISKHEEPMLEAVTSSSHVSPTSNSNNRGPVPKRGLEWSLRSLHSIDTGAQHFLTNYYSDHHSSTDTELTNSMHGHEYVDQQDQTAYEIFKSTPTTTQQHAVWSALHAPLRTGIVDGKKVVFELREQVTQPPTTSRQERLARQTVVAHSQRSSWEVRLRLWLMHFSLATLSLVFLAAFLTLNLIFAGFFMISDTKCCGDSDMDFGDVLAFTVQTSTTIGYGGFTPHGTISNFLVLVLSYSSTLLNTIFAGLLFTRFVTPVINIQFSDCLTLCNVNGVPCLSLRLGNADGYANRLSDINVRLTYSFQIPYVDHKGEKKFFRQTEELKLLENRRNSLLEVWTLRHVLDESSPLFGLHWDEHPANKIYLLTLSVDAVQELTKSSVNVQTDYGMADVLVGHMFQNQVSWDEAAQITTFDYSKMSATEPYPVWYPARTGVHDTRDPPPLKTFGAM